MAIDTTELVSQHEASSPTFGASPQDLSIVDLINSWTITGKPQNLDGLPREKNPELSPRFDKTIPPRPEATLPLEPKTQVETEHILIDEEVIENAGENVSELIAELGKFSLRSIKNALPKVRQSRDFLKAAREKVSSFYAEHKTGVRRGVAALGGLAIAGVVYKYAPDLLNNHTHDQTQSPHIQHQAAAPEVAVHQHVAVQVQYHAHRAIQHISKATAKANEIFVKPGEGISQKIRDALPGHSPIEYAQATQAVSAKFGSHVIEGISKYRMSDGSWGLSHAGKAHWGPHVREFLQNYFSRKKA